MSLSGEHPGTAANASGGNFSFTCNNCCLCSRRSGIDGLTGPPHPPSHACSRGDGADVHEEDAARCVFLRVMPAAIRFPHEESVVKKLVFFFPFPPLHIPFIRVSLRLTDWQSGCWHDCTMRHRVPDTLFPVNG